MISHLDGTVSAIAPEGAVIEVGGVGLLVQCTPGTLATLRRGDRARVATSLVLREDALTLFGFAADDERDVFELLQTASGVGPRLALAMLAVFTPDELRRAVAAEDVTALTRVPGIGRKGAQRIVLELAGRLDLRVTAVRLTAHPMPVDGLVVSQAPMPPARIRRAGAASGAALAGPGPGRAAQPGLAGARGPPGDRGGGSRRPGRGR